MGDIDEVSIRPETALTAWRGLVRWPTA